MTQELAKSDGNGSGGLAKIPPTPAPKHQTKICIFPGPKRGDPDVQAIVKIGPGGQLRSTMTHVALNEEKGEIFGLPQSYKDQNGDWKSRVVKSITAAGYDKLNLFAGVSFVAPETVKGDDGADRPNPCIERGANGEVQCVRVRQIGIGRVATGNLVSHDLTVNFDLRTYLIQDIWSKWTGRKKDPPKAWGIVIQDSEPLPADTTKAGRWAKFNTAVSGVSLFLNLMDKDVLSILGEHINRQKFAERNAVTICRRNILKKFFAAAKLDASLSVPVVGWMQADRDLRQLAYVAAEAGKGRMIVDGTEELTVEREAETVSEPEEVDAALAGEADEDMVAEDAVDEATESSVAPTAPATEQADPCVDLRGEIRILIGEIGEQAALPVVTAWGKKAGCGVADCTNPDVLAMLLEDLKRRQLELANERGKAKTTKPTAAGPRKTGPQGELIPGATRPRSY